MPALAIFSYIMPFNFIYYLLLYIEFVL